MPKILQVCNTTFYLNHFLSSYINDLRNDGFEVECVCEGDISGAHLESVVGKIHFISFPRKASFFSFFKSIIQLSRIIQKGRYHCVQSHNRNASIVARIASWLCKVPINLYTAHGMYYHDDQSTLKRTVAVFIERLLAKITSFSFSQSKEDSIVMQKNGAIKPEKIVTIGNGVDTNIFRPLMNRLESEKILGLSRDVVRIATTCRIVKQKGIQDLISAFSLLKKTVENVELLIIGGNIEQDIDPFQDEILKRIEEYELEESVVLTNLVSNVNEYLAVSDIFVLPSYREGVPKSIVEAMAVGLPIIATRIRGCKELVEHGKSGYLYPAKNVSQLFYYLEKLSLSIEDRKIFGRAGRNRILDNYQLADYNQKQIRVIKTLFKQRHISFV